MEHVDVLRTVIQKVKAMDPFHIDAMVILPRHLHTVWTLPVGDADYATRWGLIKAGFSRRPARRRAAQPQPRVQRRAGHLTTALLGTRDPR